MPVVTGMLGEATVEVLRDTGCSGVIVKRDQLTGELGHVMTVTRTVLKVPIAKVKVDTPYFSGTVEGPMFERYIVRFDHWEHSRS